MMWPEACFMLLQSSLYSLLDGEQVLFSFWELNKKQYEGFEFYQIFSGNIVASCSSCSGVSSNSLAHYARCTDFMRHYSLNNYAACQLGRQACLS
ncbi:TPA: hypothetical protein NBJ58_003983 [Escherichia coli]|nr:hypothetical protein [Escherichia coli]HBH9804330.1 hypothetical protein [Escherichia coli]HCD2249313.1 hypothetical protein [Escherichia coli]